MSNRNRGRENKLRLLSPIREVSGVVPVKVVPRGKTIVKPGPGYDPILVQALPPIGSPSFSKPGPPSRKVPIQNERYHQPSEVDEVVADYLHYARYRQTIPVMFGSGSQAEGMSGNDGLHCSCCVDRNRENAVKLLSSNGGVNDDNEILPSSRPHDQNQKRVAEDELDSISTFQNASLNTIERPGPKLHEDDLNYELGKSMKTNRNTKQSLDQYNLGQYRPNPFANTYLNPEYKRPYVIQHTDLHVPNFRQRLVDELISEADSKYNFSMQKLDNHIKSSFELPLSAVYEGKTLAEIDEEKSKAS